MKKKILIISGGISKERFISLDTGLQVAKELRKNSYNVKISEPNNNLEKKIKKFKPDVIFNALHGQFGEDGYIQSVLERFKIPYTHSGVIASSIAMNKEISKKIFIKNKIKTPMYEVVTKKTFNSLNFKKTIKTKNLKYPLVIKPNSEGSSIGVKICKNYLELKKNTKNLLKTYDTLMVETFIGGQEIQVAVLNGKALGAIELKPKRKFYDYKAKYFKSAKTNHIMPANISKKKYNEVLKIAERTHKILRCRGVTRSDFKFINNQFYLLEINTQPGMTDLSLVPEIAKYKKISFDKLVQRLIVDASLHK